MSQFSSGRKINARDCKLATLGLFIARDTPLTKQSDAGSREKDPAQLDRRDSYYQK